MQPERVWPQQEVAQVPECNNKGPLRARERLAAHNKKAAKAPVQQVRK